MLDLYNLKYNIDCCEGCNYSGYVPFIGTVKELKEEIDKYKQNYNIKIHINNNIYNNEFNDLEVETVYAIRGDGIIVLSFTLLQKSQHYGKG